MFYFFRLIKDKANLNKLNQPWRFLAEDLTCTQDCLFTRNHKERKLSLLVQFQTNKKREKKKKNKAISRKRRVREGNDIGAQETKN